MSKYKKRPPYQKKSFESTGVSSDTSANIYMSMLMSPAWAQLSAQQKTLYLYCKAQYYGEKQKPEDDALCFTMNQSKWCGLYKLYQKSNASGFYRDISKLIEFGFIRCVSCGSTTRTKSVYGFSDMWQHYGTEAFNVPLSDMTSGMLRKRRNKKV